jgi:hypothetical protein
MALSVTYELENDKSLFGAVSTATLHITGPAISLEWRYTRDQSAASDLDISELRWRSPDLQNERVPRYRILLSGRTRVQHRLDGDNLPGVCGILYTQGLVLIRCREDGELGGDGAFRRLGYFSVRHDGIHGTPLPHFKKWPGRSFCIV